MNDESEYQWIDLVTLLKKQLLELGVVVPDGHKTSFHNRIWETVRQAFERGGREPQART